MATFTSGAGPYTLILNANEVGGSADVGSNTSKVSWSLQMRADSAYCQWNPGPGDFEVRINGGLVWSAQNPSLWYGGMGGTLTLASGTTTVGHNSDGSKTVYCEGKYIANSTANYLPNSSTCGGNLTLFTIPRASSFSSITGNTIGGSQTINIDRKSSSFTHSLWYKIGNGSWIGIGSGIGTSKTWTLPTSLNNQIPNSTSLTLTYILRTYNGSTQIGSDVYYNYTVYYSGNNPNAGSVAITYANLFNGKFIANHSTATIKHTGYGGVYGSSIKSAQVIFNGGWKGTTNYNTGKLTAGTHTFQGVVTDSRNKTVYTGQQSFTCHQINNPTVSINAYRSDAEGNASPSGTYITIIPTYSAHDPVGGNSIKTNSFTCTSLMTTGTAIGSGSKKILSNAAVDSEYVISGTVTDQLGRSSATSIKVGTAFTIWDVRPDQRGMAFGKYSTGADKFEVAWNAYFDKSVNVSKEIAAKKLTADYLFQRGYLTSPTQEGATNNMWTKMATFDITYRYGDANGSFVVEWIGNGEGYMHRAEVTARVKQQEPMGQAPYTSLYVDGINVSATNFALVKVTNTSSVTSVQLWARNFVTWSCMQFYYVSSSSGNVSLNTSSSYQADLPSGLMQYGVDKLLNRIYPIGSIYTTTSGANPSTFIGGTWVQFGQGRTLVGVNTSDSDFNTVGKTGGSKEQTMVARIGAFDSDIGAIGYAATGNPGGAGFTYGIRGSASSNISGNRVNHNTQVVNGNGKNPTTVQPYITVYFWKRTA